MNNHKPLVSELIKAMNVNNIFLVSACYEGNKGYKKVHTVYLEDSKKESVLNSEIENLVINTICKVLSDKYPNWEMGAGSSGSISFEIKDDKLSVFCEHTEYFLSSQTNLIEFEVSE